MKAITLLITILFFVLPLSAIDKGSWEIYPSYNTIYNILGQKDENINKGLKIKNGKKFYTTNNK